MKKKFINFINEKINIQSKEIVEKFKISKMYSTMILNKLIKNNFITKHGSGRNTYYSKIN